MLYFYISSEYGHAHPKTGKKSFHHGIDLAGTWQENVRSTAPGTVVFAGREGWWVSCGLNMTMAFQRSMRIYRGSPSALAIICRKYGDRENGNTGRSAGSHLHYEIQVDGKSVIQVILQSAAK